jgi:hypothetical protein
VLFFEPAGRACLFGLLKKELRLVKTLEKGGAFLNSGTYTMLQKTAATQIAILDMDSKSKHFLCAF